MVDEIQSTVKGAEPDFESLKQMPFMKAVIDETLRFVAMPMVAHCDIDGGCRLYPPVPVDPKAAVEDDVLPNGYKIPKGVRKNLLMMDGFISHSCGGSLVCFDSV